MQIEVLESLPGNGKSHSTLRYIEAAALADSNVRWIYCTEYLDEIDRRTAENPEAVALWRTPSDGEKASSFIELLREPKVQLIAITHALLLSVSRDYEVNRLLKDRGYNLFLDETLELISAYGGCSLGDFKVAETKGWFTVNDPYGKVTWVEDDVARINATSFDRLAKDSKRGVVFCATSGDWTSMVQIERETIFTQFSRVVVATYQVEHTLFDAYLAMKGIKRIPCKDITCGRNVTKATVDSRITFCHKHDRKFANKTISSTWWDERATSEDFKLVSNAIRSVGDLHGCKGNAHLLGFTVPGNKIGAARNAKTVYPKGYPHTVCYVEADTEGNLKSTGVTDKAASTYIPCNARASNAYANKTVMVHAFDRYPAQIVARFLDIHSVVYSREVFALNEMLQWLFRSAIRNGESITVAVLSKRMRGLLKAWLADE
jgi:hypothetical protein